MRAAAANLDFEKAATLRDDIKRLRNPELGLPSARPEGVTRVPAIENWLKRRGLRSPGIRAPDRRGVPGGCSARRSIATTSSSSLTRSACGSLTVVLLTGFFTGAVLALQSGLTLDQFGARPVVGRLVERIDGQGTRAGADGADADGPDRLRHRRRTGLDGRDGSDQRACARSARIRFASWSFRACWPAF